MKKIFLILSLMISFSAIYALDATVTAVTGKAERLVGDNWVALEVGNKLAKGDIVQTGFKSELVLQIGTATVNLSALSRVTIEQLAEKKAEDGSVKDTTSLYVDTGSVHSAIKKTTDNRKVGYTVRNPVATASVRGTEFVFATKYRSAETRTLEGSVAVWKTKNKEVEIAPDEEVEEQVTEEEQKSESAESSENGGAVVEETPIEEAPVEANIETVETESPADNPPAETPKTPAPAPVPAPREIASEAPRDAFIVSQGQNSKVESSGKVVKPKEMAKEKAKDVSTAVQSAMDSEAAVEQPAEIITKKATIILVPSFE